jgi:proline dehydrogenase
MGLMRSALLKASESRWLREQAARRAFARRAVSRFLPGERLEDALQAAAALRPLGVGTLLTRLGESVTDAAEADAVAAHYLDVLERLRPIASECEISVKPTQLGLDLDRGRCAAHLVTLAVRAAEVGCGLWIDMEQSRYVDATLALAHEARAAAPGVAVALQAYLHRTPGDLDAMIAGGIGVRLVKGAYQEPAAIAYPAKKDVDAAYVDLGRRLLRALAEGRGVRTVFGTHDTRIIALLETAARDLGLAQDAFEFHLLYGIQRAEQARLAQGGRRVRVLISYGAYWFPWYMRRLAERPANLLFVAKSLVSG